MEHNSNLKQRFKYLAGAITGFSIGVAGFLVLFKIIILDNTLPADELAPGIVALASLINGVLFAVAGRAIQRYLNKED